MELDLRLRPAAPAAPLFTAGNIRWTWDKDPSYLATKPEVLGHMQHILDVLKQRVPIDEYFGWSYVSHEEAGGVVRTTVERDGEQQVLESERLVKALGFNVEVNDPLTLSSKRVNSVSPDFCDVRTGDIAESDTPIWVIGGGKTAMDTIHTLVTSQPGREVNLLAGSGTWFMRRTRSIRRRPDFGVGLGSTSGPSASRWPTTATTRRTSSAANRTGRWPR